ncbi:beta-sandwich domain-containing protein [Bdellovibrio sp. ArHS]|uniref:beta-sandwich domain-containing protein n=1 Tax=Bdellovibrio sp. ArHS TaxID=1569284 RepID=UPI000B193DBD|nr:beta-sandwich domain-containing protein [Bdellovibrio sp. ArHS]
MKKQFILGMLVASTVMQAIPAKADKETIGNIIGGVIGGAIGSQIGKGNGNTAAIIIGSIAGTMIGGQVGRDLDEADRRAFNEAQQRALREQLNQRTDWDGRSYGSRSGARGSFTSTREGYNVRTNEYCREYVSVIQVRGRTEETRGIACSRADGSWYEVQETEIRFGSRPDNSRPPRFPDRPQRPERPPMPPPVQSLREGTAMIDNITRRTGGEWYRLLLRQPLRLERLELIVWSQRLKVHEASVVTQSSARIPVQQLTNGPVLNAGSSVISENLNIREAIVAIDLRLESYGGVSAAIVKALSLDGYPELQLNMPRPPAPPVQPGRPPVDDGRSLKGFCADQDHQQFYAAKNFAYATNGLDMTESAATQWALDYNSTHRCGTLTEYKDRFSALYSVAYATDGLDMTTTAARAYALKNVENVTVQEANKMAVDLRAAKGFAYASDGLNMTSTAAATFGRNWVESGCEDASFVNHTIWPKFRDEYRFAYSSSGLNMTADGAVKYAVNKVASMTRCGYLLRR